MTITIRAEEKKWPADLVVGRTYFIEIELAEAKAELHGRFEGYYASEQRPARFTEEREEASDRAVFRVGGTDFFYVGPLWSQFITIRELNG